MKVRIRFIGVPGIQEREIEVDIDDPEVKKAVERLCSIFPEIFPSPSSTFERFLILVEDSSGKTTNIRLKNGLKTKLEKEEKLVIMPPLTGGKK